MGKYFKDKTEVLKVRFTKEQDEFLMRTSVAWGISKSAVVRSMLDTYMQGVKKDENK